VYDEATSSPVLVDTDGDGLSDSAELAWKTEPLNTDSDDDNYIDFVDERPNTEDTPPKVVIQPTHRSLLGPMYAHEIRIAVFDNSRVKDIEVNGSYNPPTVDQRWRNSEVNLVKRMGGGDGQRDHISVYEVLFEREFTTKPHKYYVNATDAQGNTLSLLIEPSASDPLSDLAGEVDVSAKGLTGAAAAVASTEAGAVSGTVGAGVSATGAAAAGLTVGLASLAYEQRTRTSANIQSVSQESIVVPSDLSEASTFHDGSDLPVKLPSGAVFDEPPVTIGDTNPVRGYGEELITRVPGVDGSEDIQHVINHPSAIYHDGPYKIVIGDNSSRDSNIKIKLISGVVVSASSTVTGYDGKEVDIKYIINKIVYEKDDWDHNQLGETGGEVAKNIQRLIENPDEVYSGIEPTSQSKIEVYVKGMILNGNEIIVWGLVVDGKVITAYVPTLGEGPSPPGSNYEDVYDREHAINKIHNDVIEPHLTKVVENAKIIDDIDQGGSKND